MKFVNSRLASSFAITNGVSLALFCVGFAFYAGAALADDTTAAYYGFGGVVAAPSGSTTPTATASTPWWPTPVARDTAPTAKPPAANNPPAGAPNIVVFLADDLGYSDIGAFGSEISTPNLDKLAANGVRFRNYTTHSLCSPTRAALLTGINGHSAGVGFVADSNPGFPGYAGEIQQNAVTLAEILHLNGYTTIATGKWHLTQDADRTQDGPYNSWPLQRGFDQFYGFLSGETHPQHPDALYEGNSLVQVDQYPNGFNTSDLWASKAISYVKQAQAASPNKPFFLYFADNAVHAPLNPDPDLLAAVRAKGQYSAGWDAIRQARYQKQLNSGLIPANTVLPPLNPGVSAWSAVPADKQQLFTKYQEAYAAWVATLDRSFGQVYNYLESAGLLNNTIIVFASDNGGSQEGGLNGATIAAEALLLGTTNVAFDETRESLIGGPQTSPHYPLGWATVSNTPFRGYKQQTLGGGRRVPLIVSWPGHITDNGAIRTQFAHVTDITPTLLDVVGVQQPTTYNGVTTKPLEGTSIRAFLDGPNPSAAAEVHTQQYFELAGNRGYYLNDGTHAWYAVTEHTAGTAFSPSEWELYDLNQDFSETNNLASAYPAQVTSLDTAFTNAAWAHQVYPLFQGGIGLLLTARQPAYLANYIQPITLSKGDNVIQEDILPLISPYWNPYLSAGAGTVHTAGNYSISATVNYKAGDQGIIFAEGGDDLGLVLYVENGNLNLLNDAWGTVTNLAPIPLTPGTQNITLNFTAGAPTGVSAGNGLATLTVNGSSASAQLPAWFVGLPSTIGAPAEGLDVGLDRRAPVSWRLFQKYGTFRYTNSISQLTVTPGVSQP